MLEEYNKTSILRVLLYLPLVPNTNSKIKQRLKMPQKNNKTTKCLDYWTFLEELK